ncbi:MAG: GDP-mannose 4,6-dehydratase [Candidatus Zambryskibacteria bacterium]
MNKNNQKRALITGITGQDGSYLAELLVSKGYKVFGLVRRTSTDPLMRIEKLYSAKKIDLLNGNLRDSASLARVLREANPDEVYNLAAQSDVGISFSCPEETFEVDYHGLGRLVLEIMAFNPKIKVYQASTSEMFGATKPPQNENSPFKPVSPYGKAKLRAHEDYVVGYREKHNLFICSGFLFNHESPRRGKHFVTRKIAMSMVKIKLGLQDYFELGNLDSKRDWGYAGDYVEVMWQMLQQKEPQDFVISTGKSHTVRDFVNEVAKALEMDIKWQGKGLKEVAVDEKGKVILRINEKYFRKTEVDYLLGDSSKAKKILGFEPKCDFKNLVKMMVEADMENIKTNKR